LLFWTVSNLTYFNNLPSDYPLDSCSVEWLILGRVLDTGVANPLLRRDALRSVTPVQGLYKLARNAKHRFKRRQSYARCLRVHGTPDCCLGWACVGKENFSRFCHGHPVRQSCVSALASRSRGNEFGVCT
jgi:hypothetical protein